MTTTIKQFYCKPCNKWYYNFRQVEDKPLCKQCLAEYRRHEKRQQKALARFFNVGDTRHG